GCQVPPRSSRAETQCAFSSRGRIAVERWAQFLTPSRNCAAPPAVGQRFREFGEVRRLHLLNLKTTLADERRDVPCPVTAREHAVQKRFPALLPPAHARLG